MIILSGLQAAGKSSFYRSYFEQTHVLISKDLFRGNKRPASRQRQLIEEAFQAGQSVVVDNTNVSRAERAELIELAKEYGAEITGYYFPPEIKKNLERNRARIGKERVPDIAIFAARKRWEEPERSEGFDHLYRVMLGENSSFEIELQEG